MASYPRTNSLAFAKSNCHTCSELKRWCDRQRPRCGTCIKHRLKCGGYVLNLTWKQPSGSQEASSSARSSVAPSPGQATASDRQFKFKQGKPKKRRSLRPPTSKKVALLENGLAFSPPHADDEVPVQLSRPGSREEAEVLPVLRGEDASNSGDTWLQAERLHSPPTPFDPQNWPPTPSWIANDESLWQDPLETTGGFAGFSPGSFFPNSPAQLGNTFSFGNESGTDATSSTDSPDSEKFSAIDQLSESGRPDLALQSSQSSRSPLSYGILYNDIHHKFSPVLSLYDEEFCVIPLTMDCTANPFRVRQECVQGSQYLLHAVLALSMQHLAKQSQDETLTQEMQVHRSTATHLYSEALSKSDALVLLDTLLILVNLDVTQSASGAWDVHLLGAFKLLESAGGVRVCNQNPRRRAQIAMLVWWDITVALLSRQEPIFPLAYLEALLECNPDDGWTFFSLNGCPGAFVHIMARLAKLSSMYEKVSSLHCEWTTFNLLPVELLVEELKNWNNEDDCSFQELEDDEDPDIRRDRYHCSEAWRYGIMLYAKRVFSKRQDQSGLQSIKFLSRIILDHIRCIKQDALIQKQVLIPIFLAAAEAGDESDRAFARQYNHNWSSRCRYYMFETAQTILERIWAGWEQDTRDVYWWGVAIQGGSWTRARQEFPMADQLLLG